MVNSPSQPNSRPATPPPSSARGSVSHSHMASPATMTINTTCRLKPPYGNYAPRACGLPALGASGARRSRRFSVQNEGGHGFADALPPWSLNRAEARAPYEPAYAVSSWKWYNSRPHTARWTCQRFPEPRSVTHTALPMQSSATIQPADQSKSNQIKPVAGEPPHPSSVLICVNLRSKLPAPFPFSRLLRILRLTLLAFLTQKSFKNAIIKLYQELTTRRHPVSGSPSQPPSASICVHLRSNPAPSPLSHSSRFSRLTLPIFLTQNPFKNAFIKVYEESSTNWDKPQPIPGIPPLRHCAPASSRYHRQSRQIQANQGLSRYFDGYFPSPSMPAHRSAYQSLDVGRWMFDVGC